MKSKATQDSIGGDDYNMKLSENRADAVRTYLVGEGVSGDAVTAKGFGKTMPVADNSTSAGRQANRRVELVVSGDVLGESVSGSSRLHHAVVSRAAAVRVETGGERSGFMSELGALFKTPRYLYGCFLSDKLRDRDVFVRLRPQPPQTKRYAARDPSKTTPAQVPGSSDLLDYFDEIHEHSGVWGSLMTELSRLIGTEAAFEDKDARQARHGAGFVGKVAHCSTEVEAERIRKIVQPFEPLAMQWYWSGAIRSLI